MWHRAYFSLFIGPTLLHLCVICRKFLLHANSTEFGHTPTKSSCHFPVHLLERNTCTHANTKQMTNITESVQHFQYYSVDKHRHISIHSTCKKMLPRWMLPPRMQFSGNHSYDTNVCGFCHSDVTSWWRNQCISHFKYLKKSFNRTVLNKSLLKNGLKSVNSI